MMMARSLGQNQKLVSASFAKLQFWTEGEMVSLHAPKICQWVQSPGLKSLVGRATSRKKLRVIRAKENMLAVQITNLDQNAKEVDSLKFFKEQHWVFA